MGRTANEASRIREARDHPHCGDLALSVRRTLDKTYVESRAKWEPLYEATQIKGDGEAHPALSPNDELADYETWDVGNLDLSEAKTPDMLQYEYAREALKNGLLLEQRHGTNPYKFGMVGSTDSHTALSTAEEDNFFGKHAGSEPSPERMLHPFTKTDKGEFKGWQTVASGLAAAGRARTRGKPSSTQWRARRSMPPRERGSWSASSAAGTTRATI